VDFNEVLVWIGGWVREGGHFEVVRALTWSVLVTGEKEDEACLDVFGDLDAFHGERGEGP
jgi:hypothetical protein